MPQFMDTFVGRINANMGNFSGQWSKSLAQLFCVLSYQAAHTNLNQTRW